MGIKLADKLSEIGKEVFGWDNDWRMNYTTGRKKYGAQKAFKKLINKETISKSKNVILSHDIAWFTRFNAMTKFRYRSVDLSNVKSPLQQVMGYLQGE